MDQFSRVLLTTLLLIGAGAVTFGMTSESGTDKDMQRLLTDLVAYSKEVRPIRNSSETLTIAISLKLHNIIDFRDRILTARITVEQVWHNYWMRWKPEAYGGIKHTVLLADQIWRPDIAIYNSAEDNHYFHGPTIKVYYTGYQEWKSTQTVRVWCPELSKGNIAEQRCGFELGSWTYNAPLLDVQHKSGRFVNALSDGGIFNGTGTKSWKVVPGIDLSEFRTSRYWNITKPEAINTFTNYTEPVVDLKFQLTLTRLSGVYKSPETLVWILLTFLPLMTFLVPAESSQKVSLAGVNVLLVIVTLTMSRDRRSDSHLGQMQKFYLWTMILDVLAIVGAVTIVWTHSRSSQMSKFLKNVLTPLAKMTFVTNPNVTSSSEEAKAQASTTATLENSSPGLQVISRHLKEEEAVESMKGDWLCLSLVLNRLCFVSLSIFSLLLLILYFC